MRNSIMAIVLGSVLVGLVAASSASARVHHPAAVVHHHNKVVHKNTTVEQPTTVVRRGAVVKHPVAIHRYRHR